MVASCRLKGDENLKIPELQTICLGMGTAECGLLVERLSFNSGKWVRVMG